MQSIPHSFEALPEKRRAFDAIWADYNRSHGKPWDPVRIMQCQNLMEVANAAPPGDYIELGTSEGLMAKVIWKLMDPRFHLYLLDTFEGFVEQDLVVEKQIYENSWEADIFPPTSPERVLRYIGDGRAPANVTPIKGWFPETYAGLERKAWRFVHIDFDLYQPIKRAMELCWPQLVPGGVMVVHDYGCFGFPAAKKAVDEFCATIGMVPVNLADRWGSVALIKPRRAAAA